MRVRLLTAVTNREDALPVPSIFDESRSDALGFDIVVFSGTVGSVDDGTDLRLEELGMMMDLWPAKES